MESPGMAREDGGLALSLFSEHSPPLSRKGPKQKGPCVLCNTIKSGSWRRHHLVDGTICNRCYCRTVRLVKQQQGMAGAEGAAGARARADPHAWDADLTAAGSEAAGVLALRQLANEPAPPAKRPKQSHSQHPAAAADDGPMALRPRRQHSGFAAHAAEHPSASSAFVHAGAHPDASAWATRQQQALALAAMAGQPPEGARSLGFAPARQGQHAAQLQGASGAAGGEAVLQHLLGALLQRASLDSPASQVASQPAASAAQPSVWGRPLSSASGQGQSSAWHPPDSQPATQQLSLQQLLGQQALPGRQAVTNPLQQAQEAQQVQQAQGPLALLQQLQHLHSPSHQQQPQPPAQPSQPPAQQAQRREHAAGFTPLHQQLPRRDLEAAAAEAVPPPLLPALGADGEPPPASDVAKEAGRLLEELQEDCWAAAGDLQEAAHSASLAWARCQRQLAGESAVLLAVLPGAALALPSGSAVLHPAGALLVRVLVPVGGVAAAALEAGASSEARADLAAAVAALTPGGLAPALRIVVYGTAGVLLECWDGLPAVAAGRLGTHPRAGQACWSDGDDWDLVFPGSPEGEDSAALRLFKAVLRVPVQQLAALPAADLAPANDAPGHAAGSGPSLGQPALLQRLRQVQRQLQASQPSPAAQADLKPSTGEAPPTEAPASVQTAADGYTGTHPLHSHSGQAGGSDSSGSGSQPGGHGPAGSGQPGVGGSAGASEGGQPSAAGQGGQSGDAHDPCSSGSPLVGSGNAGEELQQQQQQPGEPQQPKAEPELQLQGGQEEAEEDEEADPQQRQQPGAAGPAQDQNGGPARHSQPLDPLCSAFIGAAPLAPPPPAVPFEASGASREVELLAAAAKAFSAAPGPRADSGCASHSRAAGSAVQAAAEAAAAGNLLSGLDSLGPLSLSSLQGQPSSLAALDLASVPGLLDSLRSLLSNAGVGHAQPH